MSTSMPSAAREVTPRSAIPQGTMWPNMPRSVVTLSATPCSVRRRPGPTRRVRTPMAATLRGFGPSASSQTPGYSPDAGGAGQAEVGQRVDHHLLEAVHVGRSRGRVVGHGDDRVGHQLARAVIGDVAAAVGPLEHGPDRGRVDEHVTVIGVRAERVGVRVLEDEQVVVVRPRGQGVLQLVGLVVRDRPERADTQHRPWPQSSAAQSRLPRRSDTRARNSDT